MKQNLVSVKNIEIGSLIDERYRVEKRLGYGGMGLVVLALDEKEQMQVALKFLHPRLIRDENTLTRFRYEVVLTREFRHPNIVRIFDFVHSAPAICFISMEFVDGYTLGSRIYRDYDERPLLDLLFILEKVTRGVAYAHTNNVLHRDLKPDNILVGSDGSVKISDFGFAIAKDFTYRLTKAGYSVGTIGYMSPEQLAGEVLDTRSDIYALGILAYELATGKHPFQCGNDLEALRMMHLEKEIPLASSDVAGIPSWYNELIHCCAARNKNDRLQSAEEVLTIIREQIKVLSPEEACPIPQLFMPIKSTD